MGMTGTVHISVSRILNASSTNSAIPNRDRFVLSNGHLCGYKISMDFLN